MSARLLDYLILSYQTVRRSAADSLREVGLPLNNLLLAGTTYPLGRIISKNNVKIWSSARL